MVIDTTGAGTVGRISELSESVLSLASSDGDLRFRQEDVVVMATEGELSRRAAAAK